MSCEKEGAEMFKHEKLFSQEEYIFIKYTGTSYFLTPVAIISVISYVYIRSSMTVNLTK